LKGFLNFKNQFEKTDDGQWAVRVEDVVYGIAKNNSISLEDKYSDLAVIDTIFPGLYIPQRVWENFTTNFFPNVTGLNCTGKETILDDTYEYCFVKGECSKQT
jgi:hypothetical protein